MPRYKCKSIAALDIALSGLPAKMRVKADAGTGVSVKTVGELRKVMTWSRESGDNDTAGTPSRKHSKNQQGYLSDSHLAETLGQRVMRWKNGEYGSRWSASSPGKRDVVGSVFFLRSV
jgi:hypothetical protein